MHNVSDAAVDLGKWSLDGVEFVFPWGTVVGPGDRIVVASNNDPNIFHAQHPGVSAAGYYGGRLSKAGERVSLLDDRGNLVDSVEYSDDSPWPVTPGNDGPSLEMVAPGGDSQSPYHWRASLRSNGTPGLPNSSAQETPPMIVSGFLAEGFDGSSYVQLLNTSSTALNLGGWQVIAEDEAVTLEANSMLAPGARVAVDLPLPSDWSQITVLNADGKTIDGVRFGRQAVGHAFTRSADDLRWRLSESHPDGAGVPIESAPLTDLRLNEWLANPTPGFDDWLELVNTQQEKPVVLTGLHVGVGGELFIVQAPSVIGPGE